MSKSKYKNLIIVGNGFDIWLGLPSSYEQFRQYYYSHVDNVISKLNISKYEVKDKDGTDRVFSPVEMIYGNALEPDSLRDEFFWNFETSLDKIDDQIINLYFGREEEDICHLQQAVNDVKDILRKVFADWIQTIQVSSDPIESIFPGDSFFINFNYTDTLEKRFGIASEDIYYIHGNAKNPDSIIVGHTSHPEKAFEELKQQKAIIPLNSNSLPRLKGLYAIEDALYQTDKHVEDNIDNLCFALFQREVHIEDFENIYVLGHSFGLPDHQYFQFLNNVTRVGCNYDSLSAMDRLNKDLLSKGIPFQSEEEKLDRFEECIYYNIQYASHGRDRRFPDRIDLYEDLTKQEQKYGINQYDSERAEEAVHQRFLLEQSERTHDLLYKMVSQSGLKDIPEGCHSVLSLANYLDHGHEKRERNAKWHISYYSEDDKNRIESLMKKMDLNLYQLYPSIEECLES